MLLCASSPLKNAIIAFFNLARFGAKLRTARKIATCVVILSSLPCDVAARRIIQRAARLLSLLVAVPLSIACAASVVRAVEPAEQFLEALRQHQLYAEALDYLEQLGANPHISEVVKKKLPYEQGVALLEMASHQTDHEARKSQLARASETFASFLKSAPDHELAGSAKNQLANVLIERGRAEIALAKQSDKKDQHQAEGRKYFEQARGQFTAAETDLDSRLQKMPKLIAPSEAEQQTQKRQLASDLAQVRMLRASIDYELAQSFAAKSAEGQKHLKAAAKAYAALYEAYRTRSAGQLARLWEGRCYQEMGDIKQALGCYQELMDLPWTAETRTIKTKSTRQALECWTQGDEKKYPEAIERGELWEKEAGPQQTDADALAIRYLTALAYQGQSSSLPAKDPNRKKFVGYARQSATPVAMHPGEYQRPAKTLLVALAAKDSKAKKTNGEPTTFSDAVERGKQALEQMQEATERLKALGANANKTETEPLQRQADDNKKLALNLLGRALSLADNKVGVDDLNSVRYYLCFLAWDSGQYHEAAVLGEFLATRYPDSVAGKQGAQIALAAYVRLMNESKETDKTFEAAQLQRIADTIFKRWPDQEEADQAALTLLDFYASQRDLAKALTALAKVSDKSPRRGQAELRAGQTLWSAYLRASQAPSAERPDQAQLDQWKKQADEVLTQGVTRLEKAGGDPDAGLLAGVFALAQICVDSGQPEKAIGWLERPKIGPLPLLKANAPVATREPFATEVCKLALRAYIGVQPQQLSKAEAMMDALDKRVQSAGDTKAAENLTAIYISLGRELQQQLESLRKAGKKKELESISKAFEIFLDRVTKRDTSNSFAALNWVGATYFSLGSGFDDGAAPSPQSKNYFQKAAVAYSRMLDLVQKDPSLKDQANNLIAIRLRLADCYRRSGEFEPATEALIAVLKEKPNLLAAQVQAAETYQARGAVEPSSYSVAIKGGSPGKDGKNVVWGWAKISIVTQPKPQTAKTGDGEPAKANPDLELTFHQARLKMAESRYQFALTENDSAKRAKILEAAKQDLWYTYKLQPELGGESTIGQYDQLLKRIQKSLGDQEVGLAEFKTRDAASASNSVK